MSPEHSVELGLAFFLAGQGMFLASHDLKPPRRGLLGAFGLMVSMLAGFVITVGVGR